VSKKVVVIGAGPGGLAAAMLLSQAGLDVTVLDRQPYVGGRTSTFTPGDFDLIVARHSSCIRGSSAKSSWARGTISSRKLR